MAVLESPSADTLSNAAIDSNSNTLTLAGAAAARTEIGGKSIESERSALGSRPVESSIPPPLGATTSSGGGAGAGSEGTLPQHLDKPAKANEKSKSGFRSKPDNRWNGSNKPKAWAPTGPNRNNSNTNSSTNGSLGIANTTPEVDIRSTFSSGSSPAQAAAAPTSTKSASTSSKLSAKVSAGGASWAKIAAPTSPPTRTIEKPPSPMKSASPPVVNALATAAIGSTSATGTMSPITKISSTIDQQAPPNAVAVVSERATKSTVKEGQRLADKPMTHKLPPGPKGRERGSEQEKSTPSGPAALESAAASNGSSLSQTSFVPSTNPISRSGSPQAISQKEPSQLALPTPPPAQMQQEDVPAPIQTISRPPPGLNKQPNQHRTVQQPRKMQDAPVILPSNAPVNGGSVSSIGLRFGSVGVGELGEPVGAEAVTSTRDYSTSNIGSSHATSTAQQALSSNDEVVNATVASQLPQVSTVLSSSVVPSSTPSSTTIGKPDIAAPAAPILSQYSQQQQQSQRAMQIPAMQMLQPGLPAILNIAPGAPMTVPDANAFAQQMVQLGGFGMSGVPGEYAAWGAENRGMMGYYDPNNYGQSSAPAASVSYIFRVKLAFSTSVCLLCS